MSRLTDEQIAILKTVAQHVPVERARFSDNNVRQIVAPAARGLSQTTAA